MSSSAASARPPIVVEHLEYRVRDADHDAFSTAFASARRLRLAARGCRSVELTKSHAADAGEHTYRATVEWRSENEHAAFLASDGGAAVDRAMAAFPRHALHLATKHATDLGAAETPLDAPALRRAFGHYPTGVAVITAAGPAGPVSMIVTSFATVSMTPPLASFCAGHTSTSWPVIADVGKCCINFLAASQGALCRTLGTKRPPGSPSALSEIPWTAAPSGAPILDGVVGWLDCRVAEVRIAGDHDLVLLEIVAHDANPALEPLVFHRSAYRTLAAAAD